MISLALQQVQQMEARIQTGEIRQILFSILHRHHAFDEVRKCLKEQGIQHSHLLEFPELLT